MKQNRNDVVVPELGTQEAEQLPLSFSWDPGQSEKAMAGLLSDEREEASQPTAEVP